MKLFLTPYIYILFFCSYFSALHSQNLTLKISAKDTLNNSYLKALKYQENHPNEKHLFLQIDSLKFRLEKLGFLNNRLDTVIKKDTIYNAYFTLGNSTKVMRIYYDTKIVSKEVLQPISKEINSSYFDLELNSVPSALNHIASSFEKKGDAFAEVYLTSISVKKNFLESTLTIEPSLIRTIDKIVIQGEPNFPNNFIKHYFNLNNRTIFSRKKISTITNQIKALPFVDQAKSPEVLFTNDSTFLYIYLKKKKSNKFDGLIGFSSTETNNNIQFNGYLDLTLNNIFKGGERLAINWKNNGNDRQFFNLNIRAPYIFNSPVTPEVGLNIYKQDSTFINTKASIDLNYTLNYRNEIGLSYISESSTNLLDNPISNLDDYRTNLYGLNYRYTILNDDLLYPTKFNFDVHAYIGSRKIVNLRKNSQTRINLNTQYIFNLNFKNSIFVHNTNGILLSDNFLTNELFRIGGVNSIRGFNEESIFASLYTITNIEFRYRTNTSSYLYTITDVGFIQNDLENIDQKIYSLGLGYTFNTNFGLLNLSYALGKLDTMPFSFSESRFHLKIVSFF